MYDKDLTREDIELIVSDKIKGSFAYMALALLVTVGAAFFALRDINVLSFIIESYSVIFILQLIIGMGLAGFAYKANTFVLTVALLAYSVLTGFSLTAISLIFEMDSVISILIETTVLFVVLASYGYFTKKDFYSLGRILTILLISIIISSVINLFFSITILETVISSVGMVLFMLYTIYDVNNTKNNIMILASQGDLELLDRVQIIGAFSLYLDFINLFIYMLRLFGKRKN